MYSFAKGYGQIILFQNSSSEEYEILNFEHSGHVAFA